MNKTLKKFGMAFIALIAAFGIAADTAFAATTTINQASNDLKTLRVSNYSAAPGSMTWSSSVNTSAGQIVSVGVYYHNTGTATAQNLRIKLSPQTSGSNTNHTFSVTVSADNANAVTDSASVHVISGSESLTYIPSGVYWYPNQACKTNPNCQSTSLPYGQDGSELFNGNGLRLGDIAPGWSTQGGLTVQFRVSDGGSCNDCNGQKPTVTTYNYSSINNELGNVTLNGYFNAHGYSATTWFQYKRNGDSTVDTTHQPSGSGSGSMMKSLSGLSSGTYQYRAVASNQNGTSYGEWVSFTIDRGDCNNDCGGNGGTLDVVTRSAEDIDEDSAVLVGDLQDVGDGNVERWFEWDTNRSDVEDGDGSTLSVSGDTDNEGEFSKRLGNLDNGRTYYFRACGRDDNGDEDCGSVKSFTTDDNGNNNDNSDLPDITTLGAISVGSTIATVDGYYDANGCSVTTYYEYGRTSSLGSRTSSVNRGTGSGSMVYTFTGLSSNTTYYYRAVGSNCEGTSRGSTRSFTTSGSSVVNPPVITGTGTGNAFIQLTIDNHRDIVRSNTDIAYDVQWGNVTRSTLKNLVLQINFPDQMVVVDTDRGSITRDGHQVIVEIDELGSLEKGDMTITTQTKGSLKDGDPVVAQAIMAFENPKTGVAENAIAYDSDEFSSRAATGLGASLFGLDFLPGSLAGWLLILVLILIIIVLARHFMAQNQNKVMVNTNPTPVPPTPDASGNDYIVYRPTPKG